MSIYTQPSNNDTELDDPSFVAGTTDNVDVSLTVSCCTTELRLIGVDGQGNIGVCEYDLGDAGELSISLMKYELHNYIRMI